MLRVCKQTDIATGMCVLVSCGKKNRFDASPSVANGDYYESAVSSFYLFFI